MATVHQKNMSTLKQRKEDFVTGLNGGSITEINAVTSIGFGNLHIMELIEKFQPYASWHIQRAIHN